MSTKNLMRRRIVASLVFIAGLTWVLCPGTPVRADDTPTVKLFDALDSGDVKVKFIPANSVTANVLITNETDQVVHIQLPDAIAAVPILAQLGQQFGQQQGGGGGGGGNQSVGGGLNGGGNGGQQGGQQGGFLRIAPQKTRKVKATTVCMEYGKPDPNPRVAYKMVPITELTTDKKVIELCTQLGQKQVDQKLAQAVAWHLVNGLDWQQIAKINRIQSRYLGNIPMFTSGQVRKAKDLLEALVKETSVKETSEESGVDSDRYASKN